MRRSRPLPRGGQAGRCVSWAATIQELLFKVVRTEIAQGTMNALAIVEDLDVVKDAGPGDLARGIAFMIDKFGLE